MTMVDLSDLTTPTRAALTRYRAAAAGTRRTPRVDLVAAGDNLADIVDSLLAAIDPGATAAAATSRQIYPGEVVQPVGGWRKIYPGGPARPAVVIVRGEVLAIDGRRAMIRWDGFAGSEWVPVAEIRPFGADR